VTVAVSLDPSRWTTQRLNAEEVTPSTDMLHDGVLTSTVGGDWRKRLIPVAEVEVCLRDERP
jgi:hypothetical protein